MLYLLGPSNKQLIAKPLFWEYKTFRKISPKFEMGLKIFGFLHPTNFTNGF